MIRAFIPLFCFLFAALLEPLSAGERPNVVIIFIDDLGYGDVGFNGATGPKTPHLDQMAAEGMRFDHFYVGCAVCSGSRTSLMTGCHYQRLSMAAVLFPRSKNGLHPQEVTLADMLKETGYQTACVGKWHLGHLPPCLPTYQGFDSYYGVPYSNDMWLDSANKLAADITVREDLTLEEVKAGHQKRNLVPLMRGEEVIEYPADQKTLTKRYTEESIRFIKANKDEPFFLYLPHTMVHLPLAVSKAFENRTDKLIWDAIEEVDWSVGQVLQTLRDEGLAEDTLVLFTSDNGAAVGTSLPLRAKKGSVYDGGIREPTVMWWPKTIPAGKVCTEVAGTIDMLPTLAALCEGKLPAAKIDGKDIRPLMLGSADATSPHKHYVLMHGPGTVRSGPWKYYPWKDTNGGRQKLQNFKPVDHPVQLYNVFEDIGERNNVAAEHPQRVAELQAAYETHLAEIKANKRPTQVMTRPAGAAQPADPRRKSGRSGNTIDWAKVKIGDVFESSAAPSILGKTLTISASIEGEAPKGVIVAHGGSVVGYSLYATGTEVVFSTRSNGAKPNRVRAPLAGGKSTIVAAVGAKGKLSLQVNDADPVTAAGNKITRHPAEPLSIGHDAKMPVDEDAPGNRLKATIHSLVIGSE